MSRGRWVHDQLRSRILRFLGVEPGTEPRGSVDLDEVYRGQWSAEFEKRWRDYKDVGGVSPPPDDEDQRTFVVREAGGIHAVEVGVAKKWQKGNEQLRKVATSLESIRRSYEELQDLQSAFPDLIELAKKND